jgi:hypothetical protein
LNRSPAFRWSTEFVINDSDRAVGEKINSVSNSAYTNAALGPSTVEELELPAEWPLDLRLDNFAQATSFNSNEPFN